MQKKFEILNGGAEREPRFYPVNPSEQELRHFRRVMGSVLQEALDAWAAVWDEFQRTVETPELKKGFKPECGWPEFLEKMRLLRHYLDYSKRFCD